MDSCVDCESIRQDFPDAKRVLCCECAERMAAELSREHPRIYKKLYRRIRS